MVEEEGIHTRFVSLTVEVVVVYTDCKAASSTGRSSVEECDTARKESYSICRRTLFNVLSRFNGSYETTDSPLSTREERWNDENEFDGISGKIFPSLLAAQQREA